jgi:hypothetical protein
MIIRGGLTTLERGALHLLPALPGDAPSLRLVLDDILEVVLLVEGADWS